RSISFPAAFLESHRACDLERNFRRIDLVIGTVVQRDLHIFHFVAGKNAAFHGFLDALLDRLDVFTRNRAADDGVFENETGSNPARLDRDANVTVLAAAAGLADVLAFRIGFRPDRFLVGHLGLAYIGAD